MSATIVPIWSDVHCPWATVVVHRFRRARDELGLDVAFDPRPWPLEWVNEQGTPRRIVEPEAAVLAAHEPALFSGFRGKSWPSTMLPAFELIAAARQVHGVRAAEEVDFQLRVAFFRDSSDISVRYFLAGALDAAAAVTDAAAAMDEGGAARLDADAVMHAWLTTPVRATVEADWQHSKDLPIQGSPQIFWPDGSTTHNPGLTEHTWERGLPRIAVDDASAPYRLLQEHVG